MAKKLLSTILKERTETIEFRAVRKNLMVAAQNNKSNYRIIRLSSKAIMQLQNEGITIEKITEFNQEKYLLSW